MVTARQSEQGHGVKSNDQRHKNDDRDGHGASRFR